MNTNLVDQISHWHRLGHEIILATVIKTWGSSPRPVGSKMAINDGGEFVGSVTAGCVEGAVIQEAITPRGLPRVQILEYGVSDYAAQNIGLSCGGNVKILLEKISESHLTAIQFQQARPNIVLVSDITPSNPEGFMGTIDTQSDLTKQYVPFPDWVDKKSALEISTLCKFNGSPLVHEFITKASNRLTCFFDPGEEKIRLLIVGGVHISVPLIKLARTLNFEVIVIEPRRAFAKKDRFPDADKVIHAWPDEPFSFKEFINHNTAVAILTHDPKIDDLAAYHAVRSQAFYVGVLGNPRTQELRKKSLEEQGIEPSAIANLKGPIGLKIGAKTPEEIALAIIAEVVQEFRLKKSKGI